MSTFKGAYFRGKVLMRHPFWILNSTLLLLFIIAICIVLLTQQRPPRWESIEPTAYIKPLKKDVSKTEVAKIYENDLFDTYKKPLEELKKKPLEYELPSPPMPQQTIIPEPPTPVFLDPLQITLKGIIIMGNDQKNRVIIEDNKTKQEMNFKIGDRIDDAQIIRVFRNRAILVRSNGQEEILYLREKDAKAMPMAASPDRWESVIKKTGDYRFSVDPDAFIEQVSSLAQLIESLDMTTVYRKGKAIGIRIGTITPESCGHEFGLEFGDIIVEINKKPVTSVQKRLEIYKNIITMPLAGKIEVILLRNNQPLSLNIKIEELGKTGAIRLEAPRIQEKPIKTVEDIEEEKVNILKQKQIFAPTIDEIRKREKKTILKKVKRKELKQEAAKRPPKLDI